MSLTDDLTPAPGRTVYPLDGDWTAVVLEPLRGHPYRVLGFFRCGVLEVETDDACAIRAFMRTAARSAQGGPAHAHGKRRARHC